MKTKRIIICKSKELIRGLAILELRETKMNDTKRIKKLLTKIK